MDKKKTYVAYLLWCVGGLFGFHLFYLRRDKQAFLYWCTFGGYMGIGPIRDLFRIPTYVRDINEDQAYMGDLSRKMREKSKPPWSMVHVVAPIIIGNSWCFLISSAVPKEEVFGVNLYPLMYLSPLGAALVVWVIFNIGRSQVSFKWPLIGSFVMLPFMLWDHGLVNWSPISASFLSRWKGLEWRRTPYVEHTPFSRFRIFTLCWLVYCSLWSSYLYFNAEVTDRSGETTKLRDAVHNFLKSPVFEEFKMHVAKLFQDIKERGFKEAWDEFIDQLDPSGEIHALKVLGLPKGATQEEITGKYKSLSKEFHPDRVKDPTLKTAAHEHFLEIAQAYEKLSIIKKRRSRKNKMSDKIEEAAVTEKPKERIVLYSL